MKMNRVELPEFDTVVRALEKSSGREMKSGAKAQNAGDYALAVAVYEAGKQQLDSLEFRAVNVAKSLLEDVDCNKPIAGPEQITNEQVDAFEDYSQSVKMVSKIEHPRLGSR